MMQNSTYSLINNTVYFSINTFTENIKKAAELRIEVKKLIENVQ
jgi:hypothetical protein